MDKLPVTTMHFDTIPVALGIVMSIIDVIMMGSVKQLFMNGTLWSIRIIPFIVLYALQVPLFGVAMSFTGIAVMNLMWDLISNILVTATGLLWFGESVGRYKRAGIVFAFIALTLLSISE